MATQTCLDYLGIHAINLDMNNPRIAKWIEMYGANPTAEQIALALGVGETVSDGGTTFRSLKDSIRTHGGIIHPIIVNRDSAGNLTVIEGNTRVAIYKEFLSKNVEGTWTKIPAVIHDNLSLEEIDAIRLQSHLVGPRAWDPYSKAKYLHNLRQSKHLTYQQIVDYCGGKESEVRNYISAFEDMENYYRPLLQSDDQFDPTRFSGFVELQRTRVLKAISDAGFSKTHFSQWIIDHKIHKNESVRSLPKVLSNPRSKEVFLKNGNRAIEKALLVLETPSSDSALKEATLYQLASELTLRVGKLSYQEFTGLKKNPESTEVQTLLEAYEQLKQMVDDIFEQQ